MSPFYSGVVSGQLDVGDDQDWFVVTLDANEGLEVEINYSPSFTSPINGTVYNNEFDLAIYDSNSNQIDYSYLNNPEIVTTNTSVLPHGGTIYVQIIRYAGYGSYDLELWTWKHNLVVGELPTKTTSASPISICQTHILYCNLVV